MPAVLPNWLVRQGRGAPFLGWAVIIGRSGVDSRPLHYW